MGMTSNARLTDQAPGGRLLPISDAAVHCGVTSRTMRRWIRSGLLRGVQLTPRTLRVPADALARFIQTQSAAVTH